MISSPVRVTVDADPIITLSAASTSICSGESVVFTATGGLSYEFFVDGVSEGPTSTLATMPIDGITDQEVVTVQGENAQNCFATSNSVTITVNPQPTTGSLGVTSQGGSALVSNTMCSGEFPIFTATGGATYEFYVNGIQEVGPQVSGNIFNTVSDTTNLTDTNEVSVKVISVDGCSLTVSLTIRVIGFTGTNVIGNAQNVCSEDTPAAFTSISTPTAIIAGAEYIYQWQIKEIGDPGFEDIEDANSEDYAPSPVITTTDYRRKVISRFNGVPCEMISSPVRVTVDADPIITLSAASTSICSRESVVFTARGGLSYEFFVDGLVKGNLDISYHAY